MYKQKQYRPKKTRNRREEDTHGTICDYIRLKYPDVIFHSDGSGLRLPIGLAKKWKRLKSEKAIPDLFIAEPMGKFAGLYIEIKREGEQIFRKDGGIVYSKDDHLKKQAAMLDRLKHKGYASYFAIGVKMATDIIDQYLKGEDIKLD